MADEPHCCTCNAEPTGEKEFDEGEWWPVYQCKVCKEKWSE